MEIVLTTDSVYSIEPRDYGMSYALPEITLRMTRYKTGLDLPLIAVPKTKQLFFSHHNPRVTRALPNFPGYSHQHCNNP